MQGMIIFRQRRLVHQVRNYFSLSTWPPLARTTCARINDSSRRGWSRLAGGLHKWLKGLHARVKRHELKRFEHATSVLFIVLLQFSLLSRSRWVSLD